MKKVYINKFYEQSPYVPLYVKDKIVGSVDSANKSLSQLPNFDVNLADFIMHLTTNNLLSKEFGMSLISLLEAEGLHINYFPCVAEACYLLSEDITFRHTESNLENLLSAYCDIYPSPYERFLEVTSNPQMVNEETVNKLSTRFSNSFNFYQSFDKDDSLSEFALTAEEINESASILSTKLTVEDMNHSIMKKDGKEIISNENTKLDSEKILVSSEGFSTEKREVGEGEDQANSPRVEREHVGAEAPQTIPQMTKVLEEMIPPKTMNGDNNNNIMNENNANVVIEEKTPVPEVQGTQASELGRILANSGTQNLADNTESGEVLFNSGVDVEVMFAPRTEAIKVSTEEELVEEGELVGEELVGEELVGEEVVKGGIKEGEMKEDEIVEEVIVEAPPEDEVLDEEVLDEEMLTGEEVLDEDVPAESPAEVPSESPTEVEASTTNKEEEPTVAIEEPAVAKEKITVAIEEPTAVNAPERMMTTVTNKEVLAVAVEEVLTVLPTAPLEEPVSEVTEGTLVDTPVELEEPVSEVVDTENQIKEESILLPGSKIIKSNSESSSVPPILGAVEKSELPKSLLAPNSGGQIVTAKDNSILEKARLENQQKDLPDTFNGSPNYVHSTQEAPRSSDVTIAVSEALSEKEVAATTPDDFQGESITNNSQTPEKREEFADEVSNLISDYRNLKSKYTTLQQEFNELKNAPSADLVKLTEELKELNHKHDLDIKRIHANHDAEKFRLEERINSRFQDETNQLNSEINSLKSQLATATESNTESQSVQKLHDEISTLHDKHRIIEHDLMERIRSLEEQRDKLLTEASKTKSTEATSKIRDYTPTRTVAQMERYEETTKKILNVETKGNITMETFYRVKDNGKQIPKHGVSGLIIKPQKKG